VPYVSAQFRSTLKAARNVKKPLQNRQHASLRFSVNSAAR